MVCTVSPITECHSHKLRLQVQSQLNWLFGFLYETLLLYLFLRPVAKMTMCFSPWACGAMFAAFGTVSVQVPELSFSTEPM